MSTSNLLRLTTARALSGDDCRLLVESVVDHAMFLLDDEGRIATWSRGAEHLLGYRVEEIIGQSLAALHLQDELGAGAPEQLLEAATQREWVEVEGWRRRKDGSRFWANVVITALREPSRKARGFGVAVRDLSARRRAEAELQRAEQRWHDLVDAVVDYAIFMLDLEGRVTTWNVGASRVSGYSADEIIGRHASVFLPPEERAAGKAEKILEVVRSEGRHEDEGWRVRKDGTRYWANVITTALRDADGQLFGFAKVTRDLTARRQTEEALRRSEERFRLLVENVAEYAIYMLDPSGRVETWNLGAQRMNGYSASQILGRHFECFFPAEDVAAGKPERELALARERGRCEDEGWRVRKDGSQFWAESALTALHDQQGELIGFAKITRDLTDRHESEAAERRLLVEQTAREVAQKGETELRSSRAATQLALERAEEASRAKDEFLAVVSHELRTPLTVILGWSTLLKDRLTDTALAKPIAAIHRHALAQVKIIDDILDVSRVITGKFRLEPRPMDLIAVAREALEVARPSADAKQLALQFVPSTEHISLVADPERIHQVIWNLLSNAIKFSEPGGRVRMTVTREANQVVLAVEDDGRGIEPEFLPFVFDRFRQAESSTTRRVGGLGLGLALVRDIVHLHGGHVSAASAGRGKGATFTITLAIRAPAPSPANELGLEHPAV